jgi:hypothetical protein
MEQDLKTSKTAARPSNTSVEEERTGGTEEQKIDRAAMKSAKRAENRIASNEERIPGSTIFSK